MWGVRLQCLGRGPLLEAVGLRLYKARQGKLAAAQFVVPHENLFGWSQEF